MADTEDNVQKPATEDAGAPTGGGDDDQPGGQGKDPGLVDDKAKKLTGTGAPGSHSALFGLTPDGHKEEKAEYSSSGKVGAAHSEEDSTAASGEGAQYTGKNRDKMNEDTGNTEDTGDSGSRAPDGAGVKDQMDDPRVAEKGHGGDGVSTESTGKPGGGSSMTGPSQGTGTVGEDA